MEDRAPPRVRRREPGLSVVSHGGLRGVHSHPLAHVRFRVPAAHARAALPVEQRDHVIARRHLTHSLPHTLHNPAVSKLIMLKKEKKN